eukprot:CAMPEP_0205888976 /NCGR_PEP_ID=MMETSP1083-20121108/20699_1 /ASSEMBLY_ACC=CAM_ASM_000430 /TAXON_ID=97485 /ORGANISM="Prymnesium parvum, Strain Texoma1" /LENGTH=48 /DNA_ID= /DNA_START= /DNA_END= /DNA_ORIENTATION=
MPSRQLEGSSDSWKIDRSLPEHVGPSAKHVVVSILRASHCLDDQLRAG